MHAADWTVIGLYFLIMVAIGIWSYRRIKDSSDFFTTGGKMPWWLAGISHHMSGYSAAVFVAFAGVAYTNGFTLYVWWAAAISIAVFAGAFLIAPRWVRLRLRLNIESPLEYLTIRYNVPTQQVMAWSGVILKTFDVGAKWAAIAVIMSVFSGLSLTTGILITGVISLFYIAVGGLWADALTDFSQFVVQLVAGVVMFVVVLAQLGGVSSFWTMWDRLPPENSGLLSGEYTLGFVLAYLLINFLSYNGGTWNLAQRYIATPQGSDARKAALLSAGLYLFWPIILFFPMWAAPILLPDLEDPTQSYALLTQELLPAGLVGLVLASMFAHTMAMTTSDANAISSVVTRDILPVTSERFRNLTGRSSLRNARIVTVIFTAITLVIAIQAESFGGVLGLLILWFAALVGPTSIPMLLGLLPAFKHSGPAAAIVSWAGGLAAFAIVKYVLALGTAGTVAYPVLVSGALFVLIGLFNRGQEPPEEVNELLSSLESDAAASSKPIPAQQARNR